MANWRHPAVSREFQQYTAHYLIPSSKRSRWQHVVGETPTAAEPSAQAASRPGIEPRRAGVHISALSWAQSRSSGQCWHRAKAQLPPYMPDQGSIGTRACHEPRAELAAAQGELVPGPDSSADTAGHPDRALRLHDSAAE